MGSNKNMENLRKEKFGDVLISEVLLEEIQQKKHAE